MESTQTFGVDFLIRKCKSDKTRALIFIRITVNGERAELSIKQQIAVNDWDTEKGIVKGRTSDVKKINTYMEDVKFRIREKYRLLEDKGHLITAETVKDAYLGIQTQLKGRKLTELLDYYKKIWEEKLKKGGYKNYKTTIEYVRLFLESHFSGGDIYLSQVNMELATEFEHYIRNNPKKAQDPCLGNGLAKHVQRFKRILNWGTEIEWIKSNPIERYRCPLKKAKRKKLSLQEIVAIEDKHFTSSSLAYVKELFINSCYTGFAFIDAMALEETHFEWELGEKVWCKIYRTKSDELCAVPLLEPASIILRKYREDARLNERKKIFPPIANQTVNASLKIIQEICEINTPLTFHVARHTFAKTIALKNGVPLETIQMMLGHTKISTTQIYADVDEEKILADMSEIDNRLNIKRQAIRDNKLT